MFISEKLLHRSVSCPEICFLSLEISVGFCTGLPVASLRYVALPKGVL
jgi:hypothetical protein